MFWEISVSANTIAAWDRRYSYSVPVCHSSRVESLRFITIFLVPGWAGVYKYLGVAETDRSLRMVKFLKAMQRSAGWCPRKWFRE